MFTINAPEGYEWVLPANEPEIEMLRFDGQPRADAWPPLLMRRLARDDQGRALLASVIRDVGELFIATSELGLLEPRERMGPRWKDARLS